MSREEHYRQLHAQTDPKSALEREFLDELYQQGFKLPDSAQELILEVNVKPDFLYRDAKLAVFCDGSVHDHADQKEQDRISRENLRYTAGYNVLVIRYDENWKGKLSLFASL